MAPDTPGVMLLMTGPGRSSIHTLPTCLRSKAAPSTRRRVPYADGVLPCWRIVPADTSKGAILFHGGNDSLLEVHRRPAMPGPGRLYGAGFWGPRPKPLRKSGLTFTPEWEKPVGAVLDHYGAEDVTIIGVSLGEGAVHAGGSHGAAHPAGPGAYCPASMAPDGR